DQGVYIGTNYTPFYKKKTIHEYSEEVMKVGQIIRNLGYRGFAGIDSIIDIHGDLYPIIEINARFTQVTYIISLIETLKRRFRFVESRFVQFESRFDIGFREICNKMERMFGNDDSTEVLIYTYAKNNFNTKTVYRV